MPVIDLGDMSLEELKQLQDDVNKAVNSFEARRKSEARAAVEAAVRDLGFSLSDLMEDPNGKAKPTAAPKYRHPENPALTWSGRGRPPHWFRDAVEGGTPVEHLLIG